MDDITQGDTPTIGWTLDPEPDSGSTVTVVIAEGPGWTPIINRAGTLLGAEVTIELTDDETAAHGHFVGQLHVVNGDVVDTYPHDGYFELRIVPKIG